MSTFPRNGDALEGAPKGERREDLDKIPRPAVNGPPVRYNGAMHTFLTMLLVLALAGVLGVLFAGMIGVVRGGDPRRSNRLMRWRVILQGVALLLLALLLSLARS